MKKSYGLFSSLLPKKKRVNFILNAILKEVTTQFFRIT